MRDRPLRRVCASAPLRICDNGGWTDTWFAGHGTVFQIAIRPGVNVRLDAWPARAAETAVRIHVAGSPDAAAGAPAGAGRFPLLEAALAAIPPPEDLALRITTHSDVPPGASTGTSAAVTVAVLAALDRLRDGTLSPRTLAQAAHDVETTRLGQQSGVQDQLCAALGGINRIEIPRYPDASVHPLDVRDEVRASLDRQLILMYLGRSHRSSDVHTQVIERLRTVGAQAEPLETLRDAAERACRAVVAGDLTALGGSMQDNTAAQARLHPDLVGRDARRVIDIIRPHGPLGWKVNGAGGNGGSLTILAPPDPAARETIIREIALADARYVSIPIRISLGGLRVWEP